MTEKIMVIHVPCSWDRVPRAFFKSFLDLTAPEQLRELREKHDVTVKFLVDESFPLDFNRNKACEMVLRYKADYLVCLDADMVFPRKTLLMLMDAAMPNRWVVTGNYHKKGSPHQSVAGKYVSHETLTPETRETLKKWGFFTADGKQTLIFESATNFSKDRAYPVDVSGAGCLMVDRRALTMLKQPFFKYFNSFSSDFPVEPDLENISEDMYFFSELKKAGVTVWLDPRIQCGHLAEKEITFMDFDPSYAMALVARQ